MVFTCILYYIIVSVLKIAVFSHLTYIHLRINIGKTIVRVSQEKGDNVMEGTEWSYVVAYVEDELV